MVIKNVKKLMVNEQKKRIKKEGYKRKTYKKDILK